MGNKGQVGYPNDVSDEEWAFVAPYLALCREESEQRDYSLRSVFNGLRYIVLTGEQWRYMPNDLTPWTVVYQQMQRWIRAQCFETMVEDLRMLLREFSGRKAQPMAIILDSRTLQSTPESGARVGYDGAKRRKGSKVHAAVDTLGHLLALHVTPADEQDLAQVDELAGKCSRLQNRTWSWPMWTRATRERRPKQRQPSTASNCKWSSIPRPNADSSCCRAAGWWREVLPGLHASAAWLATIKDSPLLSAPSTSSLSHAS
jgi:transposase